MKRIILTIIAIFLLEAGFSQQTENITGTGKQINPYHYETIKSLNFKKAVVVSAHPLASEVGAAIMKMGGNAFDAAIATQLALAVVYPGAGNIGGGGFLLARKNSGELIAIDFRETAPYKASRDMYLDMQKNPVTSLSLDGHLAAGVPGTVAGLFNTFKHAKLPFSQLIQPAIDLAEKGFVITTNEARQLNSLQNDFIKLNTIPNAFIKPVLWKGGDTLIQKDLAATLLRIKKYGQKGFYEGETAKLIVAEMKRGQGIISLDDLKQYKAIERTPVIFNYRGFEVISFPLPSSGGILLAQMLKMIEKFPVSDYGFQTAKSVQLMIEAERRAYADRAKYMGDPDFSKLPVKTLMSDAYLVERMKDYDPNRATLSADIKAGSISESEETTHISIMDEAGNMVSVTTTLNNNFGSKTVVGGAGFLLNDEMDDFSVKPGVPNLYGAVGGAANAIAPGKRMLSSMTPTLVLKDHQPFIVVGTPGGTTIPTSVFQTLVNIIDFNMNAEDAVNKPKFHHQWLPDEVMIEDGFNPETESALKKMGYHFQKRGSIGRTELIKISTPDHKEAVADKRGDDSVSGE